MCGLVVEIAEALDHAHAHGVIHRDVKPSNILVAKNGRALLFDFGLARTETDETITLTGDFAGTPFYVSPEQARGRDVDHRTDVYSLGVTLYELLTLRRPFEGKNAQVVFRQLLTREAPLLRRVNRLVPRDLETVCLTAIEKDPARRYQSAAELAADLRRFLEFRPVRARPVGAPTRAVRFLRRNPAIGAVAVLSAVLVLGTLFGLFFHSTAIAREVDEANRQRVAAESISRFLTGMLASVAPENSGPDVTVLELLDEMAGEVGSLADQPRVEADLRQTMASTYNALGEFAEAEIHARRAAELREQEHGPLDLGLAIALHCEATALFRQDRYDEAEGPLRRAIDIWKAHGIESDERASAMSSLGALLTERDEAFAAAEGWLEGALAMRRRLAADGPTRGLATSLVHVGKLNLHRGRLGPARAQFEEALRIREELDGPDHVGVASPLAHLARALHDTGRIHESEQLWRRAVAIHRATAPEGHPELAACLGSLAGVVRRSGRFDEALALAEEALAMARTFHAEESTDVALLRMSTGQIMLNLRDYDAAEEHLSAALCALEALLGAEHGDTAEASMHLAAAVRGQGRLDESADLYRD